MKSKKWIIIVAAVLLLAIVAIAVVAVVKGKPEDKDEDKVYVNLVDKYASAVMKNYILVPERASAEGDSYEQTEINIKVYEKFTLTEEEAAKMKELIANDNWHLMSTAEFGDPGAREHWRMIIRGRGVSVDYNSDTTYYILKNNVGEFISTSSFLAASDCEIAVFDTESNAYYYVKYNN